MSRSKVKKTAVKNAPGVRCLTRTYPDGRQTKRYEARMTVDGRVVSLGQFPTVAAARAAQTKGKGAAQKSAFVAPSAGRATLLTVGEAWLRSSEVVEAKPRTRQSYASLVLGRLAPLHDIPVNKLTHGILDRFVAGLVADGLAPATRRHVTNVLRRVLDYAVADGKLAANPMASIKRVKGSRVKPYVLTEEDVARLVAHLRGLDDKRWALLVFFAAYTGCRAGEVAGLRVSDLDLKKRTVRIERVVNELNGRQELGTPKSDAGTRTVDNLPRTLCAELAAHVGHLRASDYVFGWVDGEGVSRPYRHGNFLRRVFTPAVEAVGLPTHRTQGGVGLHEMRHFYATLCIEAGMTPTQLAKRLGHANAQLVLTTYAHAWERSEDKWGDVFDRSVSDGLAAAKASNVVPLRGAR